MLTKTELLYFQKQAKAFYSEGFAAKLADAAVSYHKMLERHVWHKRSSDGKEFCIECRNLKENGHTSNCELAAILKEG